MLTYSFDDRGMDFLYEHLYKEIKNDILIGNLKAHEKLPSKRALAAHLNVSVVTVENAYSQLLAEGYIYSKPKSGFYVCDVKAEDADVVGVRNACYTSRSEDHVTEHSHVIREHAESPGQNRFFADFVNNSTLSENFPFSTWTKLMRETMMDDREKLMKRSPSGGIFELRKAIADYLYQFRGMSVSPNQIIVGAGTEYLYNRLLQLLGPDAKFGVENPGYRKITKIYDENGVDWDYVNIDDKGMKVDELRKKGINVAHVSPEHHFPIGLVMPVARRQELLNWAAEEPGRYIIEDDFDCEFRMQGKPIPSMQSRDRSHRVIYMNTFSKTMVPSLRIGYMVLPEKLMEKYISTMNFYSCTVSGFEQYAMAAFIEKGYFERHIKRLVNDYRGRREKICRMFRESRLNEISTIYHDDAGTHFLLHVKTSLSDVEIKWAVRQKGILINCLSEYCFADADKYHGILVIHYSDMDEATLKLVIAAFEEIFL